MLYNSAMPGSTMLPWLESLYQDARFGMRVLRRDLAVTAAAVLSLALAIGACTAAFSLIDALVLRPLPVRDPGQLITFTYPRMRTLRGGPPEDDHFSYAFLQRARALTALHADLFGMTVWGPLQSAVFDSGGAAAVPEKVRAQWISGDGLDILGVRPALGRLLSAADDELDARRSAAVLSYGFWKRRFGGDRGALGRWFTINGVTFQIVGVLQENFSGVEPGVLTDLWVPLTTSAAARELLIPANDRFVICGRLKPGARAGQVLQVVQAGFTSFRQEDAASLREWLSVAGTGGGGTPDELTARYVHTPLSVRSAAQGHASFLRWQFERPLWILGAVAALVWLIACSNVANLLVARAAARRREMAVRSAIGARGARLTRQVLMESGLLAGAACVIGLALALWMAPAMVALMGTAGDPTYLDIHLDARVLLFLAVTGALTTLLFGLAPALRAFTANSMDALKDAGLKGSSGAGLLRPMLAAQVGFSLVVLFVAGLLLLSFHRLTSVDLGFSDRNLLLFSVDAGGGMVSGPRAGSVDGVVAGAKARAIQHDLLDRLRRFPGVQAAATSGFALMGGARAPIVSPPVRFAGGPPQQIRPQFLTVSPGFFATMRIPVLRGREFTRFDMETPRPTAVVVNEAFAQQFFPGQDPLGKRFERMVDDNGNFAPQEIVGIVRDTKYNNLREPTAPAVYQPAGGVGAAIEVRTAANPLALAPALRLEIERLDPSLRVAGVTLQSSRISETIVQERMLAILAGFFAAVAVVLAGVGLYGVLSYSVVRRTREIGIRVALGAPAASVIRMMMADTAVTMAIGIAAGLAGGFALARLVESMLFEVKPSDFFSLALPLACLLAAAAAAALPPALRAARVDPMAALRYE